MAAHPARARLGRRGLAQGIRRSGLELGAAIHFRGGDGAGRRTAADSLRHQDGGAGDHGVRQRRPAAAISAADQFRRRMVVPGLLGAGRRLRLGVVEDPRGSRNGDHYIVNGQKTWNTLGQYADWIFCLVRTDTAAKQQSGISFLVDRHEESRDHGAAHHAAWTAATRSTRFGSRTCGCRSKIASARRTSGWTYAKFLLGHERTNIAGIGVAKRELARLKRIAASEQQGWPAADRGSLVRRPYRAGRNRPVGAGDHQPARAVRRARLQARRDPRRRSSRSEAPRSRSAFPSS